MGDIYQIEISIKNPEKSLLRFEERLSNQELAIDALMQKPLADPSAPGNIDKSIKSIQSKCKTIFDTLNIQQNSIDVIIERPEDGDKDKKRKKDQISQILGD
jgi:hypothetical protein